MAPFMLAKILFLIEISPTLWTFKRTYSNQFVNLVNTAYICSLIDVAQERTQITKISFQCVFFDVSWAVSVLKKCCRTIYIYDSLFQCEFWCALTSQLCQWEISYSEHRAMTLLPGEPSCGASMKFYWTYVCCIGNIYMTRDLHPCVYF